jgi:RHS repeat-associated protein
LTSDIYDDNGSTIGSGGNVYSYDFENRLIALNPGTANEVSFVYDGDGNRVAKTVGTGTTAVTTKFLVDTNNPTGYAQVVDEVVSTGSGSGTVQRTYVQGHSLISQTQLIAGSWVTSLYAYDGHGSVRFLTDTTGAITDTYTFDAFGNRIASTGSTPNNYLYAAEESDANLGFYYLRARYMNPSSGRFWAMDTYEGNGRDPRSLHKYFYVHQSPVNAVDPSGNAAESSLVAVGLLVTISAISTVGLRFLRDIRGGSRDLQPHVPTEAELESAIVDYNAVEITGSELSADEFFEGFVRTFDGVNASNVATVSGAPVSSAGQVLTFDINSPIFSIGQQPFDVRVVRYDPGERTISAVTLGGHPLRGWRYWRVIQLGDPHHFAVETGAVDVANRGIDALLGKASLKNVLPLWEQYMQAAVKATRGGRPSDYLIPGSQQGVEGSPGGKEYILDAVRPR